MIILQIIKVLLIFNLCYKITIDDIYIYALQIYIYLEKTSDYAALSEFEIYISEDFTTNEQDVYSNSPGAGYIMHSVDQLEKYEFDKVSKIKGV